MQDRKLTRSKIFGKRRHKSRGPQVAQQLPQPFATGVPITPPNSTHYLLHLHLQVRLGMTDLITAAYSQSSGNMGNLNCSPITMTNRITRKQQNRRSRMWWEMKTVTLAGTNRTKVGV